MFYIACLKFYPCFSLYSLGWIPAPSRPARLAESHCGGQATAACEGPALVPSALEPPDLLGPDWQGGLEVCCPLMKAICLPTGRTS